MWILAVDTTTFSGSAALLEDAHLHSEANIFSVFTHSERVLASIHFLLEAKGLEIKDIDGFAVAVGPGSFTGIRIGLGTVKSFAFASGKPVAPVSTLEALAWKIRFPRRRLLCPMIDAKKGEIYSTLFESRGEKLDEIIPQGAYTPDLLFSRLPSHRIIEFIGNGVPVFKNRIIQYFKDKARFPARSPFIAYEVGLRGYDILKRKKGVSFEELEPLYLRKSQAEEKN